MGSNDVELQVAWRRCGADPAQLDPLLARYREPHRRYHDVRHLRWMIRHVDALSEIEPVDDPGAVVAAAFFHDAVYDAASDGNEQASARLATERLAEARWSTTRIDHVGTMILATAHIVESTVDATTDADTSILLDADLAILGADPPAYTSYASGVRCEYAHLDDHTWCAGRSRFLRSMLARPSLFLTPTARTRWEHRARANLTAELAALG